MTTANAATTERLIPTKCKNAQKIKEIKSNLRFTVVIFSSQISALFDILLSRLGRLPLFIHDMHESWKLVVRVHYIKLIVIIFKITQCVYMRRSPS